MSAMRGAIQAGDCERVIELAQTFAKIKSTPTLAHDPVTWFDLQEMELRQAIRSGHFTRALAIIAKVQELGLDYEPPKQITPDSWLSEIFHDVFFLNRFEELGITRCRHLLGLSPERLRELTTMAPRIIAVMRDHFGTPKHKQPTTPSPTSGVVDWTAPTVTERWDEYGDIMLAKQIADATG